MKPENLAIIRRMYDMEATDAALYAVLARAAESERSRKVLEKIARDERRHQKIWAKHVAGPPRVNRLKVGVFALLAKIFGLAFVASLMEAGKDRAIAMYRHLGKDVPIALKILEDESGHEKKLAALIREERLSYLGSMVLGLNDALVELTGALAGFTLALNENTMIGLAGFVTGVAAALSMTASQYLSKKIDGKEKHPLKAATYTGAAYLLAAFLLLIPYAFTNNPMVALAFCLINATAVIVLFTFFVAVVRRQTFWKGFREMMVTSLCVGAISFLIGWGARVWLSIDI